MGRGCANEHCGGGFKKTVIKRWNKFFFAYEVPKAWRVCSRRLGVLYRLMQFVFYFPIVMAFVTGIHYQVDEYWDLDYVKEATAVTEMHGVVFSNDSTAAGRNGRIWDAADYVVPPLENGAKFVMTNVVVTPRQTQGLCEEDPSVLEARCDRTGHCEPGKDTEHGETTETCLNSTREPGAKVCQVRTWCPVERDDSSRRPASEDFMTSQNFSVFVKNNVRFPKYNLQRRNYDEPLNLSCRYDPKTDKHCPIFTLNTIVSIASRGSPIPFTYEDAAREGGVFQIVISWDCMFDEEDCLPEYKFMRLDDLTSDNETYRGFYFRYSEHWELENGTLMRTLYKAIGLHLLITVEGYAMKFNWLKVYVTLGSFVGALEVGGMFFWIGDKMLRSYTSVIPDDKKKTIQVEKVLAKDAVNMNSCCCCGTDDSDCDDSDSTDAKLAMQKEQLENLAGAVAKLEKQLKQQQEILDARQSSSRAASSRHQPVAGSEPGHSNIYENYEGPVTSGPKESGRSTSRQSSEDSKNLKLRDTSVGREAALARPQPECSSSQEPRDTSGEHESNSARQRTARHRRTREKQPATSAPKESGRSTNRQSPEDSKYREPRDTSGGRDAALARAKPEYSGSQEPHDTSGEHKPKSARREPLPKSPSPIEKFDVIEESST